jgi:DNA-binding HxlR family transcriptional regulator
MSTATQHPEIAPRSSAPSGGSVAVSDRGSARASCCPLYHEAVELVGKRWTGAIVRVLMSGPLRFHEIAQAVPDISDRLLSARMKELEQRGLVVRHVHGERPPRVEYELTEMGQALRPAINALEHWAREWLA